MKKRFLAVFMVLMLSSTVAGAEVIKTLNLDNPNKLGLTIEKDAKATVEGKNPIRIHTLWPTTICLGEFGGVDVQNATLICEKPTGRPGVSGNVGPDKRRAVFFKGNQLCRER